jgi:hypothetical protein
LNDPEYTTARGDTKPLPTRTVLEPVPLERLAALIDETMPVRQPGELHSTDPRWRPPSGPRIHPMPGGEETAAWLASEWAWTHVTGDADKEQAALRQRLRRGR